MIRVRGRKFGTVLKEIRAFLKENKLDGQISSCNKLMAYDSDEIIPENFHYIVITIHPGSNEGFFINIAGQLVSTINELFMIRFNSEDINEVLRVHNALYKELEV